MRPRIALLAFGIECNRFAPPARLADFEADTWLWGAEVMAALRAQPPRLVGEMAGFVAAMDARVGWEPVPVAAAWAHPNGPVEQPVFDAFLARARAVLAAAPPLDAVFLQCHGAALSTCDDDPEGTLALAVRDMVGPATPIVGTIDLHANLSRRMAGAMDLLVAYRTNPHVDQAARGAAVAALLPRLLTGARPARALVRLPIVPPTITMLTDRGVFGAMMRRADELMAADDGLLDLSVLGSFPHSDTADNGIAVLATAADFARAHAAAVEVAALGWARRAEFAPRLTPIEAAVARATECARPRIAIADLGDNPGGGGLGNKMALLRALLAAGAEQFTLGLVHDPGVVFAAREAGIGGRIAARFAGADGLYEVPAEVAALHAGQVRGRRGLLAGAPIDVGPSAALRIGGGIVCVSSRRYAANDPVLFEMLGVDLAAMRTIAIKSRGHFRAGFDEFVADPDVIEADTPGLTSPQLDRFAWRHLPRPCLPMDADAAWAPPPPDATLVG
jgi:microcystin degradation protein MlrC